MLPNLKSETKLPLINGDRFDALLRQVDPNAVLDEDVRRALMKEADQFIEEVLTKACQLTKHRRGSTLEAKDVLTVLDRCYNIHLPGKTNIFTVAKSRSNDPKPKLMHGRKKICILYGILYALSCITKHSDDFWILLIGRFLGGIATSLLYSAFESWLVCESFKQGFEEPHLKAVFANVVLGNSVVAIVSGIIAQYAADFVGLVGPFDVSAVVLIIMVILVATTWSENYGNEHWSIRDSLTQAVKIIANNKRVAYLGVVQSLFEGSMYTFVLEWTPVLTAAVLNSPDPKDRFVPHGLIFASFMICIMIGSSIFKLMANIWRPEFFMKYIFLCAAVSLTFPIFLCLNSLFVFTGFAIFEICVGVFWPASGFMRSVHVPEKARSTVMNIFRIPLNLVVVVILLFDLPITWIFVGCFLFLMLAGIFQHLFHLSIVSSIAGDEKAAPI
ncbi:Major facilitator superfamily domain-containing protein 5 [Trichinella pseudospiralis]|uniref:Transcription initiation factor TFIID subunit 12 n=1 Tax=Trichinella pseudospiralis TaxID=6337 RepID=A0A0V1IFV3_TRIPS|nr:Major facilitator superfamily domain-containing protein 5 [Trichinella pseudospiralis]